MASESRQGTIELGFENALQVAASAGPVAQRMKQPGRFLSATGGVAHVRLFILFACFTFFVLRGTELPFKQLKV